MSQYRVPNWKLSYQTQEQEQEGILHKSSNLNNQQHNPTYVLPMSNYEVAELTWEKGQLAMHSHGSIPPTASKKASTPDTLESIVHQATCYTQNPNLDQNPPNMRNVVSFSSGKSAKMDHSFATKRTRSEPDQYGINFSSGTGGESLGRDGGAGVDASASANFDKSMDRTAMTWPTFESPQSLKTKTIDQDYGSENQDEEGKTRGETGRSNPTRRSRSASVHNQSERRRRDRINQKMKALQKLVPNSNKTDKASMLDEAIEYLKQLQAQVQMMSIRNMPQMMVPLAIQQQQQQQLQMSLLARMGMDMGPGMTHPPVVAAPIVVPHMIPTHNPSPPQPTINGSLPFNHPYSAFIAQQMNVDLYNKMAAAYLQQVNQAKQATSGTPQSNYVKEE